jgi:nitrite reductase/ring-hydroxylating ferredoxin subunit
MARYTVGRVNEFAPGSRKIVDIAGRSVGIFNVNGEFFAVLNRCPHAGAPLCQGGLGGIVKSSEPGVYEYSRPNEFIRCPWHSWEFDLRTGRSWFDPARVRAKTFDTSICREGDVPPIPAHAKQPPADGTVLVAETYPVTIDDALVQVEI